VGVVDQGAEECRAQRLAAGLVAVLVLWFVSCFKPAASQQLLLCQLVRVALVGQLGQPTTPRVQMVPMLEIQLLALF
jgi:uncharacterized membrane protein YccC